MTALLDDAQLWLLKEFASGIALAFEGMLGEKPAVDESSDPSDPAHDCISWHQPFTGIEGAAWLCAPEQVWLDAGAAALKGAGIDDADAATAKSTFLEIISQAFSALARSITTQARREVTCPPGDESKRFERVPGSIVAIALAEGAPLRIWLGFEHGFLEKFRSGISGETAEESAPEPDKIRGDAPPSSKTLELLLDVELPVSVSFGRAMLPLKDVIKLTTGSIVELNRTITEPVEVIVNNCVVARGEVVVIDGNYGIRIQEVISRQERLRTLY